MIQKVEHGSVYELRLDRPPANALSPELVRELAAEVAGAPGRGAEAVVISGAPGMFSAGLDVPLLLGMDEAAIRALWHDFYGLMRTLATSPVPVAAAITGHSPAGGAVIGLFCDRRFMAASSGEKSFRIGLNEVQVGLSMPPVIHRALVRVVGPRQAARMTTESLMLSSEEAHACGLVDALAPLDGVVDQALGWCRGVLALPRQAMLATRQLDRQELVELFASGEDEVSLMARVWFGDETRRAMTALVERLKGKR